MSTLYDCARLAGVSTATVSRVLHGHDRVSATTRARVLEVIQQLGYVPDGAAQSLSRRRKQVIGLVSVERASDPIALESSSLLFADEVLHGVEATLRAKDWSLLISFCSEGDPRAFERLYSMSGKVDGLIISEGIVGSEQLVRLAEKVPVVVVAGSRHEATTDVVTADNYAGSASLTRHLVELHGIRSFHYVDGPPSAPNALERRFAFEHVIAGYPGAVLVSTSRGTFSAESGRTAVEAMLGAQSSRVPEAIVCANDQMAIGAIQALAAHALSVPEDVAVVGFDDIYPGRLLDPPLTTVRQPTRSLGERACARLLERINDQALPNVIEVLPTELLIRVSCGCGDGTRGALHPAGISAQHRRSGAVARRGGVSKPRRAVGQ
ncbi:MAG: LacI family DNA-binding transcriptional regulator [Acidimicrobiales bacterium]